MTVLTIALIVETRKSVNREMKLYGNVKYTLKREQCVQATIFALFGLCYIGRFILLVFIDGNDNITSAFLFYTIVDLVIWFEALCLGALLLLHKRNLLQRKPASEK